MTPTRARLSFLQVVGIDTSPDPANVAGLLRDGWSADEVAEVYACDTRTVYRMAQRRYACPGPRCLTMVRGGGLCSYCRATP